MELSDKLRTDFIDTTKISTKDNWEEYWKATRHNETVKKANKGIYLRSFGIFLLDRGFTHLLVSYEGSGDCGDAYLTEGFKDNEFKERGEYSSPDIHYKDKIDEGKRYQKELLDLYNTWLKLNPEVDLGHDNDLHWVLADMINYDWYNNEGGSGEVIWHLQKHKIVIDGYQNYYGQYEAKESYKLNGSDPVRKYKDIG
tara:strand:+ start:323 stop:916 length:594 start_codon:yes stop_codon:yes gene_type:complete